MDATLPTVQAVQEIESRQDEVLRKLAELETRISEALKQFGGLAKPAAVDTTARVGDGETAGVAEAVPYLKAA